MFNPNLTDVRNFFFTTYEKANSKQSLTDLEKIAYSVILEHPEYHEFLMNRDKYIDYQWTPEAGQTNPFLHLSMHLTIIEQLSINQPSGIKDLYLKLCQKYQTKHNAQHELMDCIAEMLWQAQYKYPPEIEIYFNCIKKKLGEI